MRRHSPSNCALTSPFFFCSSSVSSSLSPSLVQHTSFFPSYSLSCWTAYSSMGVDHEEHLQAALLEALKEGG